jgi:hypothetical protein
MRKAAAENSLEGSADLLIGGLWVYIEKSLCCQDDAAEAKAALRRPFLNECLLNRMRLFRSAQPFQGSDLRLANRAHRRYARPDRLPPQHHRAGTALRETATKPRSPQSKLIIQHEQQRSLGIDLHILLTALSLIFIT